jgi:hypothetical protein
LRQCDDRHIVKQIIVCDSDGVKIDVEIPNKKIKEKTNLACNVLQYKKKQTTECIFYMPYVLLYIH